MSRTSALLGSALFLFIAPGTLAGFIPWWITQWRAHAPFFGVDAIPIVGGLIIAIGAAMLLECFFRFAWSGRGTPAPVAPTEHLVVTGLYRRVRNPMYVAVTSLILGQALLFGSTTLLIYAGAVWLGFHLFVLGYEEPTLLARYGEEYERYRRAVPRWLPRTRGG